MNYLQANNPQRQARRNANLERMLAVERATGVSSRRATNLQALNSRSEATQDTLDANSAAINQVKEQALDVIAAEKLAGELARAKANETAVSIPEPNKTDLEAGECSADSKQCESVPMEELTVDDSGQTSGLFLPIGTDFGISHGAVYELPGQ